MKNKTFLKECKCKHCQQKLDYRLRGSSFVLRVDSTSLGTKYKLGTPRVDIREDGRR